MILRRIVINSTVDRENKQIKNIAVFVCAVFTEFLDIRELLIGK